MKVMFLALEIKRLVRMPSFLFLAFLFPVVLFLIQATLFGEDTLPGTSISYGAYLMCNLAAYGAFFVVTVVGGRVAVERGVGWQRQLRLTPLSPSAYLVSKATIGMAIALPAVLLVSLAGALVEGVELSFGGWLQVTLGIWLGSLPLALLGLLIGQVATPQNMQAYMSSTHMVMGLVGGVLLPAVLFPSWLSWIAKILPTYWLAEIGRGALGQIAETGPAVLVLAGWTVLLSAAVVIRYRRESGRV